MTYLVVVDDDHKNAIAVDWTFEQELHGTVTKQTFNLKEGTASEIQTMPVTRTSLPGKFLYFLKRYNDMTKYPERGRLNAGPAHQQENGDLWIESHSYVDGERVPTIYIYTDGYGADWMLD